MRDGIAIPAIPVGQPMKDPITGKTGGYQPERNPTFKKFTTRTMRPVVDFDTCIKCTLCWLQCPDSCFDVTPDGLYDANMEACCGCGVCEAVCPVPNCVTMVNETQFEDNDSQWEMWRKDKDGVHGLGRRTKIAEPPGALARLPLPRPVRGAGPDGSEDRPRGLRTRETAMDRGTGTSETQAAATQGLSSRRPTRPRSSPAARPSRSPASWPTWT